MILFPLPGRDWRLEQKFGERPEVYKQFGMNGHNGLDIAPEKPGTTGVIVYAPHEGYVKIPPADPKGYGNHVLITSLPFKADGNEQRQSTLAHFETLFVKDGDFVAAGTPIGFMGKTGFADGIHTHWTYKTLRNGTNIYASNGYKGALDILRYCCYWNPFPPTPNA